MSIEDFYIKVYRKLPEVTVTYLMISWCLHTFVTTSYTHFNIEYHKVTLVECDKNFSVAQKPNSVLAA
jgi:hypothetical protein